MKLKVKKLYSDTIVPNKPKTQTDSGFDCYVHNVKKIYTHNNSNAETVLEGDSISTRVEYSPEMGVKEKRIELRYGERALIGLGFAATLAVGYELQIRPRSGNALKRGLTIVNTPGTVDAEYVAEIGAIVLNTSRKTQYIVFNEPICQMVPMKVELPEIDIVEDLADTVRGLDGFGSTNEIKGKK